MEWEFRPQGGGWAANLGLGATLESWFPHETYSAQNGVGSSCGGVGLLWNIPWGCSSIVLGNCTVPAMHIHRSSAGSQTSPTAN